MRVWEEPHPNGVYVMGVDTAYGREDKDRHAIEIYRCFADRMVQVAEFATGIPETYQATWVMGPPRRSIQKCHHQPQEVNGPGFAVMDDSYGILSSFLICVCFPGLSESGANMEDIFSSSVRWFLYHRPDSMGAGYVYNWKTNSDNKLQIMNELRDTYAVNHLDVFSVPLLEEMERVVQGRLRDQGGRPRPRTDRVFMASALAVHAWITVR